MEQAKADGKRTLLTFGGAFSNHIAAVASAGQLYGFDTVGIIRGEELLDKIEENPTLSFASQQGMKLEFISREAYRNKENPEFLAQLSNRFPDACILPEGGTNELAVKGCEEILTGEDSAFDYICCAVGTGGTLAGLSNSAKEHQQVLGFSSLKGTFETEAISKYSNKNNWKIISDYHFGGYGKVTPELIHFINRFYDENKVPLDPVYTGKLLFGIEDLAKNGYFRKGARILAIHTGGLQGISGMNQKLKHKNLHIQYG